ncbi:M28 family metallopeptidase [Alkalihalobacillus sp. TS-13]|uniref:M28 family metallopeptidase n=1 Tax=Alkalihalobacillus sp. TS-13 TaxID=2842455 RepID=UPI001C87ED73|nr:M20/M25/M40 family metallo-hydrolase [Alkalihalobacillus sp. TS-13]
MPIEVFGSRLFGPAKLQIGEKVLEHRVDFTEWNRYSSGGRIDGDLIVIKDGELVDEGSIKDKVVLISKRPNGFDLKGTVQAAIDYDIKALLIEHGNPKWFVKMINGPKNPKVPVIKVRKSLIDSLVKMTGNKVKIDLPLKNEAIPCNNVIGFLSGSNPDKTLVLSTHYDHQGADPGGHRFQGAIDNISGVVTLLETAKKLISTEKQYPFNIVIVFFSGEESGLQGAKQFIESFKENMIGAINLDCIGQEPEVQMVRIGYTEPIHWLPLLAKKVFDRKGIEIKWKDYGGEDSVAFRNAGVPALGLGQKPLMKSVSIHTPDDTVEALNFEALSQWVHITEEMVYEIAKQKLY